ncbi:hypothetical protein [Tautonia marina]|uniref:hypothetical protein n=1 Tax=Tautonia marina TaxID=2653855 RepID=UPI001260D05C|nr:hypothetical protein [Tautonia marina]
MIISFPNVPAQVMVIASLLTGAVAAPPSDLRFDPDARDVEVLIAIHDLHDRADDGATLLAWSVLHEFLTALPKARAPGEAVSEETIATLTQKTIEIGEDDWNSLDEKVGAITNLKRASLLKAASLCHERYTKHRKSADARRFWGGLKERYEQMANRLPR